MGFSETSKRTWGKLTEKHTLQNITAAKTDLQMEYVSINPKPITNSEPAPGRESSMEWRVPNS